MRRAPGLLSLVVVGLWLGSACQEPRPAPHVQPQTTLRADAAGARRPQKPPPPEPTPYTAPPGLPETVKVRVFPEPAEETPFPLSLHLPPDGKALDRFLAKLLALKQGQTKRVRVTVWGASHVAAEAFTGRVRRRLQETFGDAGPGFVILGRPWRSYRHTKVKLGESRGWRAERLWSRYSRRRPQPRDDLFGLAGISVHARRRAWARLQPRDRKATLAALDLYYLRQPRGGRLDVLLRDNKRLRRLATAAGAKEAAFARIELPKGTRQVTLKARGGEVRIFGVDLASGKPGVILDALGINGARSDSVLKWNEALMTLQVKRLAPDLIVMAYGSNSVDQTQLTAALYEEGFDQYLQRMRRTAPGADCIVVGPADQARRVKGEGWVVPERLDWIVATQRKVALRRGCAFWDWRGAMGGKRSVYGWVGSEPPIMRRDHLHFRFRGYLVFGEVFNAALRAAYEQYRARQAAAK
jgi:hypothetical protein